MKVELTATLDGPAGSVSVPCFYDGDGIFLSRYLPAQTGGYSSLRLASPVPWMARRVGADPRGEQL